LIDIVKLDHRLILSGVYHLSELPSPPPGWEGGRGTSEYLTRIELFRFGP